jgi:hypothetical protein
MFVLPTDWNQTRRLLEAIMSFTDSNPVIYVRNGMAVDYGRLRAELPDAMRAFLQTGLPTAWPLPDLQIHGTEADWLLLPCGLVPDRPSDFVIRWNVRSIRSPPSWSLYRPKNAMFFPGLVSVQNNVGSLETFVWNEIWKEATAAFFRTDAHVHIATLVDESAPRMVNTRWRFREMAAWQTAEAAAVKQPVRPVAMTRTIDGVLKIPPMSCAKNHGVNATFYCNSCMQMFCDACSMGLEHTSHVFKVLEGL